MPLVTRQATSGFFFRQSAEPVTANTGDVWVDTDTGVVSTFDGANWVEQTGGVQGNAREDLSMNDAGNALAYTSSLQSLMTTQGDTLQASGANTPARLAIGTARQQLAANSGATALAYVASLQSLLTGTGDIIQSSGANTPARLAIGTARQQLAANSGATALAYVASLQSLLTGTGDIIQSSGANTPARLAIGTANQVLAVNSGATALEWVAAAAGATLSSQEDVLTADDTTTSTSFVSSSLSITMANRSGGIAHIATNLSTSNNGAIRAVRMSLFDDGAAITGAQQAELESTRVSSTTLSHNMSLNGSVINVRFKVTGDTGSLLSSVGSQQCKLTILEIS